VSKAASKKTFPFFFLNIWNRQILLVESPESPTSPDHAPFDDISRRWGIFHAVPWGVENRGNPDIGVWSHGYRHGRRHIPACDDALNRPGGL